MKKHRGTKSMILFDGVCNLCNSSVRFIIRNDKRSIFLFESLQSEFGQTTLIKNKRPTDQFDSLILIEKDQIFYQSTAALRIAKRLRGLWPLFYVFIIVPAPIRDFFYRLVAKNRYRIFGISDYCEVHFNDRKAKG